MDATKKLYIDQILQSNLTQTGTAAFFKQLQRLDGLDDELVPWSTATWDFLGTLPAEVVRV